ncbi:hypothetical protein SAMD00019534_022150 [Acytostelium subglobosum LB1]|uniref:hypothetical protein n=1 Tax=Acytostelium subglobosum LB1 TaxID=1410327 RepID=UPI0006451B33|nr:hypothetical protein SAMD00019534_022150 [Acytostelium subglobosum LB1]GAM19040.1 hypothetical protein SAMD00019534_022150 [Acytostelium subglobosum LB1]|eukprot:XP_012756967.1 hypothetical protein SAMD00019534_022150 [Acytostelium subglobosum LB1]
MDNTTKQTEDAVFDPSQAGDAQQDQPEPAAASGSTSSLMPDGSAAAGDQTEEEIEGTQALPDAAYQEHKIRIKTPVDLGEIEVHVNDADLIQDIIKYLQEITETCLLTNYNLQIRGTNIILNEFNEIKAYPEIKTGVIIDMVPAEYNERSAKLHIKRLKDILKNGESELNPKNPSLFSSYSYTTDNPPIPERVRGEQTESEQQDGEQQTAENGEHQAAGGAGPVPELIPATGDKKITKNPKKQTLTSKTNKKSKSTVSETDAKRRLEIATVDPATKSTLSDFYPTNYKKHISCVRRIDMSGWNPVPGYRAMCGDLFYLEVECYDPNETLYITANVKGFYVNQSKMTAFNPRISERFMNKNAPAVHHNLYSLLCQISNKFNSMLKSVLNNIAKHHQFEMVANYVPTNTWIMRPERNMHHDLSMANETNLLVIDTEMRGQPRDWNEELQSLRELPRSTPQERILRDRAFYRVNCDFVDAAIRGAKVVVGKSVPPINPTEEERMHMFVYNNIFFSFALDTRNFYSSCGGDRGARAAANNDLKGVKLFNLVDVDGISTICTAIIDYRGHRILAQSLVPGILSNEKASVVHYGSMDDGKTIKADPEFHERLQKVAQMLHLADREITPIDGASVGICMSYETKGIIGMDGRRYVLDILRATPRDPNYPEEKDQLCLLRPELIANYSEYVRMEWEAARDKQRKDAEQAKTTQTENKANGTEANTPLEREANAVKPEEAVSVPEEPPHILFNANLYSKVMSHQTMWVVDNLKVLDLAKEQKEHYEKLEEQRIKDEQELKKAGDFLKEKVIAHLLEDFKMFNATPFDGQTLTQVMHARGINMRYLGLIATQADTARIQFAKALCINEMVARATKHIFNDVLRSTPQTELSSAICHFLNCFLGTKISGQSTTTLAKTSSITIDSLWEQIELAIERKFNYKVAIRSADMDSRVSILRSICLKTGLQIVARDYNFQVDEPFTVDDIVEVTCVVKHLNPRSTDVIDILESGKALLSKRDYDQAYRYLTEAMVLCTQIHGPIHTDTANCYSNLAMAAFYRGDLGEAIEHQRNALVITEKVLGIDHHDTIHAYTNLALFCQRANCFTESIGYLKHVLYLTDLLGDMYNPERSSIYTTIAIVLQDLKEYELAIKFLEKSIHHHKELFGTDHVVSITCFTSIASMYSDKLDNHSEAERYQKKATAILQRYFGEEHPRTRESKQAEMEYQFRAKEERSKNKTDIQLQNTKRPNNELPKGNPKDAPNSGADVDELLKYVDPKKDKKNKAKKDKKKL